MITEWLDVLSTLISQNMWIAPVLALLAGVLTSLTPCALSSVPLVIGYVGGTGNNNMKRAFWLSLTFAAGSAVTFTILGTVSSLVGKLMGTTSSWWYLLLGVLMVFMAMQTWEIYNFVPSTFLIAKNTRRGYIGAFIAGILGGVFSSPCATPVLITLLAVVAERGSLLWGIVLLLFYSIGHSTLVLAAGTSIGFVKNMTATHRYGTFTVVLRIVLGSSILLIAFYMFYLGF
ncbi:cytochrome c biogenesis protein CcdA [Desulfosporosinus sp. FKB]|uniref:cytochrome c biogenesis CcdA family protein n=1 Tax=Desulfosporosinus sp. FKB TaxID=1969835 RepID=UPI000B49B830|nr:cytochrome c biogenesis protein CcdA [Desulfosporosinus sp. FKB]